MFCKKKNALKIPCFGSKLLCSDCFAKTIPSEAILKAGAENVCPEFLAVNSYLLHQIVEIGNMKTFG